MHNNKWLLFNKMLILLKKKLDQAMADQPRFENVFASKLSTHALKVGLDEIEERLGPLRRGRRELKGGVRGTFPQDLIRFLSFSPFDSRSFLSTSVVQFLEKRYGGFKDQESVASTWPAEFVTPISAEAKLGRPLFIL